MTDNNMVSVGIIMGSISDWDTMRETALILEKLGIPYDKNIISAHRTPDKLDRYMDAAPGRGVKVIIAAAGGAAHLAGVIASKTIIPVLGVPMKSWALDGLDSLLSIVQMPGGIPVPTLAIGKAGARNAALAAAAILALSDKEIENSLLAYREDMRKQVEAMEFPEE